MKIVHFHPDGRMAARFIDPLIEAERRHGHTSVLITSTRKSKAGSKIIKYDLSVRNLSMLPIVFLRICFFLNKFRPDMVISHNTKSSPLPLFAAWLMGINLRIYFNHGVPYIGYTGMLRSVLRFFEKINCTLSNCILTVSPDMVTLLKGVRQGIEPNIILNGSSSGLDLDIYSSDLYEDSTWKKVNNIKDDDMVVVYIGRPEKRKGFGHAVRLWSDYLTNPSNKLVICGATSVDVLRHLPEIPSNVICLGFVSNIPEVLLNADILILPSLHEGLSYAVLEAMAANCVVIANDIEGVRNLVDDGINGYLVKDNQLSVYADLIQSLSNDKARMSDLKRHAMATAEAFSQKRFLPEYLSFLDKVSKT